MSVRPSRILLDTNVWLDAFLPGRVHKEAACSVLALSQRARIDLLYPVHILPDVFYLSLIDLKRNLARLYPDRQELCAQAARTTAWEFVNTMREVATAVGADQADVWLACKREPLHDDVEDNLVVAAAERAKADFLVTSDRKLIAHSPVATLSPEDMVALLATTL